MSWSRLSLEDIMSRSLVSGFVPLGLVNIHIMHQACKYIRKKTMDLTGNKQVVKWQTSPVSVFKPRHCGLERFCWTSHLVSVLRVWENGMSRSRLGLEGWTSQSQFDLESLKNRTSWSSLALEGWPSWSCNLTSCGHPWSCGITSWTGLGSWADFTTGLFHAIMAELSNQLPNSLYQPIIQYYIVYNAFLCVRLNCYSSVFNAQ